MRYAGASATATDAADSAGNAGIRCGTATATAVVSGISYRQALHTGAARTRKRADDAGYPRPTCAGSTTARKTHATDAAGSSDERAEGGATARRSWVAPIRKDLSQASRPDHDRKRGTGRDRHGCVAHDTAARAAPAAVEAAAATTAHNKEGNG